MKPKSNFYGAEKAACSSARDEWETPQNLYDALDEEFHFTLDVCASNDNAKCRLYFDTEDNGLAQDWGKNICFMNPPYGKGGVTRRWMQKAYEACINGATVVCLIPARTDTTWWHDFAMCADEIRLVKGRVQFTYPGEATSSSTFPSAIVIFRPDTTCDAPKFSTVNTKGVPLND